MLILKYIFLQSEFHMSGIQWQIMFTLDFSRAEILIYNEK